MGFFEELPDLPLPPRCARDPRMGPSNAQLPVGVPLSIAVGRSDRAAVALGPLRVFSDGFMIDVNLLLREQEDAVPFFDPFGRHHGQPKEGVVRLALVFADGTRAEVARPFGRDGARSLVPQGGGGGQGRYTTAFWSSPLPPPGEIEVVCMWPAHGIAETHTSFDAQPILDAARRVEQLWPEPPSGGDGGIWTSQISGSG